VLERGEQSELSKRPTKLGATVRCLQKNFGLFYNKQKKISTGEKFLSVQTVAKVSWAHCSRLCYNARATALIRRVCEKFSEAIKHVD